MKSSDPQPRPRVEELPIPTAAIINSSDDAIISKTLEGIITSWNPGAAKVFGYSAAEAIDKPMLMLFPPERAHEEADFLARIARGERVDHFETVRVRKDGKRIDISVTLSPIVNAEGKIIGASKIARDITERKQAEELQARLAALVNFSQDAIISKTLDGIITSWNPAAEIIFGYTAAEAIGKPMLMLFPPQRVHEERVFLARIARGERVEHFETVRVRKDGRRIDISVSLSPMVDRKGKIIGVSKIARDVTKRKQVEEEVRRLNTQLEQMVSERTAELEKTAGLQNAILDSTRYAIISTTPDGIVTAFNATAEKWLGYTAAEIVGKPTFLRWHDSGELIARAQVLSRELQSAIAPGFEGFVAKARTGQIDENEWTFISKDGRRFPVLLSLTSIRDKSAAVTGFLGVATDLTQTKLAETKLKASLKEIKDLQTTLDEQAKAS